MATSKKVMIRQVRSAAGADKRTKATLAALGMNRIGKQREIAWSAAVAGQVAKVAHLVKVVSE